MDLSTIDVAKWPHWRSPGGEVLLVCAPCEKVLPMLPNSLACVSDPPYGIANRHGYVSKANTKWETKHHNVRIIGDDKPFNPAPLLTFDECILWGANYYSERLPKAGWLVWDKRRGVEDMEFSMSDAELAFRKNSQTVRIFRHLWHGLCRDSEIGSHLHPTQKPIALMEWCIGMIDASVIVDPYMGSGPTIVAAIRSGRQAIGIELSPAYFAIAQRRCEEALAVGAESLFREVLTTGLFKEPQ